MKEKSILLVLLWILLSVLLSSFSQEGKPLPPLIRKDLLGGNKGGFLFPKRNIFSPFIRGEEGSSAFQGQLGASKTPEREAGEVEETSSLAFQLTYVGYIQSPQKMIGLIILDGQVLAVSSGEMVREGYTVGNITPEEIEIICPDSEKRKFSLQGEKE